MLASLAFAALLMGLAGGPHCLAMCAAPCAVVTGQGRSQEHVVHWLPRGSQLRRLAAYHLGRVLGYAAAGALAAMAMESLAWLTQQSTALRPVWTFLHVAMLAWGAMMVLQARQPAWVERAGRSVWGRVRPLVEAPGGIFATGFLWALMPCGLLYSALLVAALSPGPVEGAGVMALFALGSGVSLMAGPWLWLHLRGPGSGAWAIRLAGAALLASSVWALWMGLVHDTAPWCVTP